MDTGTTLSTETIEDIDSGAAYKHLPIWLTLYATALGTIYQQAFWLRFNVNITQYLGLQDLIRISLMPLLLIILPFYAFIMAAQVFALEWIGSPPFMRDPAATTRPVRRGRFFAGFIMVSIVGFVACAFAVWNWDDNSQILVVVAITSLAGFLILRRSRLLEGMKVRFVRDVFLALAVAGFPLAYGFGTIEASAVSDGISFVGATIAEQDQLRLFHDMPTEPIRFLGHMGQYDFFYRPKSTFIVRSSEMHGFAVYFSGTNRKLRIPFIDPRS